MADAHVWCVGGVTLNYINSASQGVEIINQVHAEFDCRGPLPVEFWCAYGNVVERTLVLPPPTEEMPQDATSQPSPPAAPTTSQFSTLSTQPNIPTETGTEEAARGTEEAARGTEEAARGTEEAARGTEEAARGTEEAARGTEEAARGTEEAARGTEEAARGTEEAETVTRGTAEAQETEEVDEQGTEELEQNTDTENPEPDTHSSSTSPKNYYISILVTSFWKHLKLNVLVITSQSLKCISLLLVILN